MSRCLTMALACVLWFNVAARADVNDKVKAMTPPADSKEFIEKAWMGNQFEVKMAELAQQKAQSQEVKALAQKIHQDHQKAQQEIEQLAKAKGVNLPNGLKGEHDDTYRAFMKLDNKNFDHAYLMTMVKDHLHDIHMYKVESQAGTDQDVKQWAAQTLKVLRQHGQHVAQTAQASGLPVDVLAVSGRTGEAQPAGSRQEPGQDSPREQPKSEPRD